MTLLEVVDPHWQGAEAVQHGHFQNGRKFYHSLLESFNCGLARWKGGLEAEVSENLSTSRLGSKVADEAHYSSNRLSCVIGFFGLKLSILGS